MKRSSRTAPSRGVRGGLRLGPRLAVGGLAVLLAVLGTTGHIAFWQIVLIAFAAGCAQAVGMPTFQALMPTLVAREAVGHATALNSAQFNLSRIIRPAIAGV